MPCASDICSLLINPTVIAPGVFSGTLPTTIGNYTPGIVVETSNYSVQETDNSTFFIFTAGASICTLPALGIVPDGWWIIVANQSGSVLTLNPNGCLLNGSYANLSVPNGKGCHVYAKYGQYWTDTSVFGSAGANTVQATVDFGYEDGQEGDLARATVTGQSWVTAESIIVCSPSGIATSTHDPEDAAIEGIMAYAENLVSGVGFDIVAKACGDSGSTFGSYAINAMGI